MAIKIRKGIKWFLIVLLSFVLIVNSYVLVTGKLFFYRAVYYNFANIDDYKIFPNREIQKSSNPQPWPLGQDYNKIEIPSELTGKLESSSSVAFLVVQNDSLRYEKYWDGYSPESISNSFSMAKSYVSTLIGIAIKEGKIKSVDQPVADFLEEFRTEEKKIIRIKDLLTMSSGLEWVESYADPFSVTTEAYYGWDLPKIFKIQGVERKAGEKFEYKSGDTQVLGFIVEKATGKSLSEYAQEKLWLPTGVEKNAMWSLDKENGKEKAYCCINSNARDFARLGYLYLHKGNWKGNQLLDTAYVDAALTPANLSYEGKPCDFYGYQWWIVPDYKGRKIFYARGILGQLIVVIPDKNIVAVRLGKSRGEKSGIHFGLVFDIVDGLLEMK